VDAIDSDTKSKSRSYRERELKPIESASGLLVDLMDGLIKGLKWVPPHKIVERIRKEEREEVALVSKEEGLGVRE